MSLNEYINEKVLYCGEVYFLRGLSPSGRCLLAQSIDGKPTINVLPEDLRPLVYKNNACNICGSDTHLTSGHLV